MKNARIPLDGGLWTILPIRMAPEPSPLPFRSTSMSSPKGGSVSVTDTPDAPLSPPGSGAGIDLTVGSVRGHLTRLTIPTAVGLSALLVTSVADLVWAGMLGVPELAALSFIFTLVLAGMTIAFGLGTGAASLVARTYGAGDRDACLRIGMHALVLVTVVNLVVTAAGHVFADPIFARLGAGGEVLRMTVDLARVYLLGLPFFMLTVVAGIILRALGDSRPAGVWMLLGSLLQLVIAPLAVFGLGAWNGLGLSGVAWAFVLSRAAILVIAVPTVRRFGLLRAPGPFASMRASWTRVLGLGTPIMLANLVMPASMAFLLKLLAAHGHVVVAAFGIATRLQHFAILVLAALAATMLSFVGQHLGARRFDRIDQALRLTDRFSLFWGVLCFAVFFFLGDRLVALLTDDPGVIGAARDYLVIVALAFGGMGVQLTVASCLFAAGKVSAQLVLALSHVVVLLVPLALLFDRWWGPSGIYAAVALAVVLAAAVAAWWVRRTFRMLEDAPPETAGA